MGKKYTTKIIIKGCKFEKKYNKYLKVYKTHYSF